MEINDSVVDVEDQRSYTKRQIKRNRVLYGGLGLFFGGLGGIFLQFYAMGHSIREADLNGDGIPDVVCTLDGSREKIYLRNSTTGELVPFDKYRSNLEAAVDTFERKELSANRFEYNAELNRITDKYNAARDTLSFVFDDIEKAARELK